MKKKNFITIFAVSILFISFFLLTSCSGYGFVSGIKMKSDEAIKVEAGDFNYDGIKVVIVYTSGETREIDLTEDMIPEVEKLNFYKMGEHEVKVVYDNRYQTIMKINVVRHNFDDIYQLEGYTCTYDGNPHKVELNYELPEGAKIEYPYGNSFTNAGEYEVVGVISKSGYNAKTLTTTLKIEKADYDLSDVVFENQTFEYDGNSKTITATNVPKEIDVTYDIFNADKSIRLNNAVNAGEYTIVARFNSKNENFNQIDSKEAKLIITKAKYDMSKVKFTEKSKVYDGQKYSAKLDDNSSLPSGVDVTFKYYNENNEEVISPVDAGEYKMVASFKSNNANYEEIDSMEAKLTITKRLINLEGVISFNSSTFNYDRREHSILVEGNIPDNVTVEYENNKQVAAGEYKIIAHFSPTNHNEILDVNELEAYLIINKVREEPHIFDEITGIGRTITGDDIDFKIDNETGERTVSVKGIDEEVYIINEIEFTDYASGEEVSLDDFTDGKRYNFHIDIKFVDEIDNQSVLLSPASGIFDCSITFEEEFELVGEANVTYDGEAHLFTLNKDIPEGATSTFKIYNADKSNEFDEAVNVGTYQIECTISKATYRSVVLSKVLTISKATYDLSNVKVLDVSLETAIQDGISKEYNKDGVTLSLTNLPEGVTYTLIMKDYFDDIVVDNIATNNGDYKISVTFTGDENNYNQIEAIEFVLKITKKMLDLSNITLEGFSISIVSSNYYTNPQFALISGTPNNDRVPIWEIEKSQIKRSTDLPEVVNVSYTYTAKTDIMYGTTVIVEKDKTVFEIDEAGNIVAQAQDQNNNPITSPKFNGIYGVVATFSLTDTNYEIDETQLTLTADVVVKVVDY